MWGWPRTFDLPSLSKCWVTALAPSCPVWVVLVIKPMALWILGEHTPSWTSSQPSLYLSYNELAWTPLLVILPQLSLLPMNHFSVFPSLCYIRDMIPNVYEFFFEFSICHFHWWHYSLYKWIFSFLLLRDFESYFGKTILIILYNNIK